jgi:hypothetical protein
MSKNTNLSFLTDYITADITNGRIGINNASPTVAFDVVGVAKFSGSVTATSASSLFKEGYIIQATTTSGGGSQPAYTYYTAAGSKRWSHFLDVGSDKFNIANASNAEVFTITQVGNVGIGTDSPSTLLHINKSTNSGSGAVFPRLNISNSLATQGDGSSTFNFADINLSSGNGAVNMFISTTYAAGSWAPAGIINVASNHDLQFKTNNTERMRITSAGNVGIGTSSPNGTYGKLSVAGGITILDDNNAKLEIGRYSSGASNSYIRLGASSNSLRITNNTDAADLVTFQNGGNVGINTTTPGAGLSSSYKVLEVNGTFPILRLSNSSSIYLDLVGDASATYIANRTNSPMIFTTNDTERMRITSGGVLQMSNNSTTFSIGSIPGQNRIQFGTGGNTTEFAFINSSDAYTPIGASAFNTRSDYRLKEDLKEFSGLSLITNMKVYDFKWKEKNERNYGFMAHELQEVISYVVTGEKDGMFEDELQYQGLDYSKLVPVLVKAIQELSAEITILKNK